MAASIDFSSNVGSAEAAIAISTTDPSPLTNAARQLIHDMALPLATIVNYSWICRQAVIDLPSSVKSRSDLEEMLVAIEHAALRAGEKLQSMEHIEIHERSI